MFTLKLGRWYDDGPTVWITGVDQVTVIDRAARCSERAQGWAREADCYCNEGPVETSDSESLLWTLLEVRTPTDGRHIIVEKAWLLGPTGATVDRIAGSS